MWISREISISLSMLYHHNGYQVYKEKNAIIYHCNLVNIFFLFRFIYLNLIQ